MFTASIAAIIGIPIMLLSVDGVANQGSSSIWRRLTRKGYLLVSLLLIPAGITIFQKYDSEKTELESKFKIESLKNESSKLQTQVSKLDEKAESEKKIAALRFDSAQNTMFYFRELAKKENSISDLDRKLRLAEGKNLRRKIDSLEFSLRDATNTNQKNIEADGAQLDMYDFVKWRKYPKDTARYSIELMISNNGKRSAENVLTKFRVFILSKGKYHIIRTIDTNFGTVFQPSEISNRTQAFYVVFDSDLDIDIIKLNTEVILEVYLEYSDRFTSKRITAKRYFKWEGYNKDLNKFNATGFDETLLEGK